MAMELINIEEEYTNRVAREIPHYHVDVEWFTPEPEKDSLEWFLSQPYTNEKPKKKEYKWWVDEAKRILGVEELEPEYEEWNDESRRYHINFIEDVNTKLISVEEVERQCEKLGIDCCDMVFKWDYELEDYRWQVEPRYKNQLDWWLGAETEEWIKAELNKDVNPWVLNIRC